MPRSRLRVITFGCDVWPLDVYLCVGPIDAFARWRKRRFDVDTEQYGTGMASVFVHDGAVTALIWLPYFRVGNAFDAGTLAHEALHVVWRALDKFGCNDEEAHCYLLQWLIDQSTRRITR